VYLSHYPSPKKVIRGIKMLSDKIATEMAEKEALDVDYYLFYASTDLYILDRVEKIESRMFQMHVQLSIIFTLILSYLYLFTTTNFAQYSAFPLYNPHTFRIAWRCLVFIPELFLSTKYAVLCVFAGCLLSTFLYANFKETLLLFCVFILGSLRFLYISDILVYLAILYIRKNPNNQFTFLLATVKEDVLVFLLFFSNRRTKYLGIPLYALIRLFTSTNYETTNTAIIQILNYPQQSLQLIFFGFITLALCIALYIALIHTYTINYYYVVCWTALCLIGGNIWELNKQITTLFSLNERCERCEL